MKHLISLLVILMTFTIPVLAQEYDEGLNAYQTVILRQPYKNGGP